MTELKKVVVAGLGEVGKPLLEIISTYHHAIGVDISPPPAQTGQVDVLHVCFPFEIPDFVGETARYIELFRPSSTAPWQSGPREQLLRKPVVPSHTAPSGASMRACSKSSAAILSS